MDERVVEIVIERRLQSAHISVEITNHCSAFMVKKRYGPDLHGS